MIEEMYKEEFGDSSEDSNPLAANNNYLGREDDTDRVQDWNHTKQKPEVKFECFYDKSLELAVSCFRSKEERKKVYVTSANSASAKNFGIIGEWD